MALSGCRVLRGTVHCDGPGVQSTIFFAICRIIVIAPTRWIRRINHFFLSPRTRRIKLFFLSPINGNINVSSIIQIFRHPGLSPNGYSSIDLPISGVSHFSIANIRVQAGRIGGLRAARRLCRCGVWLRLVVGLEPDFAVTLVLVFFALHGNFFADDTHIAFEFFKFLEILDLSRQLFRRTKCRTVTVTRIQRYSEWEDASQRKGF